MITEESRKVFPKRWHKLGLEAESGISQAAVRHILRQHSGMKEQVEGTLSDQKVQGKTRYG